MGGSPKKCVYPHQSGETQTGRRVPAEGERNGGCGAAARQRGTLRCLSAANRCGAGTMCAGWRGACLRRRGALAAPCNAGKTHANPQPFLRLEPLIPPMEARTMPLRVRGRAAPAIAAQGLPLYGLAPMQKGRPCGRPLLLGRANTTARFYAAPERIDPSRFASALLSSVAWLAFAQPRRCVSASLLCSLL